jgi:hypothetical protein
MELNITDSIGRRLIYRALMHERHKKPMSWRGRGNGCYRTVGAIPLQPPIAFRIDETEGGHRLHRCHTQTYASNSGQPFRFSDVMHTPCAENSENSAHCHFGYAKTVYSPMHDLRGALWNMCSQLLGGRISRYGLFDFAFWWSVAR